MAAIIKFEIDAWQISLLAAFTVVQFMFYASLPYLAKVSSAAGLHLSLLATDIYVILASAMFFNCKVSENLSIIWRACIDVMVRIIL